MHTRESSALDLEAGLSLPCVPRFEPSGRSIVIAPYGSASEYDHHIATTTGSGGTFGFGEAFRFDLNTGQLLSVWVHAPERPVDSESALLRLVSAPEVVGLPRLRASAPFKVDWPSVITIDEAGSFLAGATEAFSDHPRKVRIATDFFLLLGEDIEGWILRHPARYLAPAWETPCPTEEADKLAPILAEFIRVIDEPFVARLEDGNRSAFRQLEQVRDAALRFAPLPQAIVLADAIQGILVTFA